MDVNDKQFTFRGDIMNHVDSWHRITWKKIMASKEGGVGSLFSFNKALLFNGDAIFLPT